VCDGRDALGVALAGMLDWSLHQSYANDTGLDVRAVTVNTQLTSRPSWFEPALRPIADNPGVLIRDTKPGDWASIWPFFRQIVAARDTYA
jgi:hypothetical protein